MISLIALSLPGKLNKEQCIKIALLHDLAEVVVGDIIPSENVPQDVKKKLEDDAIKGMIQDLDETMRQELYGIHSEYENGNSVEAQVVRELDKYEMMLQAFTYEQKYSVDLSEFYSRSDRIQSEFVRPLLDDLLEQRQQYHAKLLKNKQ